MTNSSVSTSSTVLQTATPAAVPRRKSILVQNTHASQNLFVSKVSPATASDWKIGPGLGVRIELDPGETLYCIGSGASTTYAVL